jgi:hypothetical protein
MVGQGCSPPVGAGCGSAVGHERPRAGSGRDATRASEPPVLLCGPLTGAGPSREPRHHCLGRCSWPLAPELVWGTGRVLRRSLPAGSGPLLCRPSPGNRDLLVGHGAPLAWASRNFRRSARGIPRHRRSARFRSDSSSKGHAVEPCPVSPGAEMQRPPGRASSAALGPLGLPRDRRVRRLSHADRREAS